MAKWYTSEWPKARQSIAQGHPASWGPYLASPCSETPPPLQGIQWQGKNLWAIKSHLFSALSRALQHCVCSKALRAPGGSDCKRLESHIKGPQKNIMTHPVPLDRCLSHNLSESMADTSHKLGQVHVNEGALVLHRWKWHNLNPISLTIHIWPSDHTNKLKRRE